MMFGKQGKKLSKTAFFKRKQKGSQEPIRSTFK